MADKLITGNSWSSGDQVTSALLNQAINSATFGTGAVDSSTTQISSGAIIVKDAGITPAKLSAGGPTWTTAGALTVSGDTVVGDNATIGYTATEGLVITGQGSTNDVTIKNDADTAVISIPTGTTNARVTGNLFVGIDDTDPSGLIQVHGGGAGQAEGGEIRLRTAADYDSTYNHYFIDAYQDDLRIGREGGADITLSSSGNVGIGTTTPSTALQVVGGIRVGNDGNEDLILKRDTPAVTVGGSIAAGIITTTGTGAGSGHVGIGTASPGAPLEVVGAIRGGSLAIGTDDTTAGTISAYGDGTGSSEGGQLNLYIAADHDSTYNRWQIDAYEDDLRIFTDVAEVIRVTPTGNVGIGTAAPTEQLDLSGDAIRIRTAQTPASATATGTAGTVCWDASYIYVCTATNTWKRVAIATW